MPIKKFEIRNIGPINLAKIEDAPSVVIIAGPNGVGKSTLLEALKRRQHLVESTGKIMYLSPYRAPVAFQLHKSLPIIAPERRYIDVLALDSFSLPAPSGIPGITVLPYYITQPTQRTRTAPDFAPYVEVKYKLVQLKHEFGRALAEVFKRYGGMIPKGTMPEDIYKPFRELVRFFLPGLEFDDIILERDIYKINFKNKTGVIVEFDQLSSGEKDIIAMLFPFVEKEIENELARVRGKEIPHEDLIVLIDTPEAYLHASLQRNLLDYVRKLVREGEGQGEKLQFFIATHSTTIVNEASVKELHIMAFPKQSPNGNQLLKVTADEDKLYLIRDLLGDIGYLASGKPILLLEGKEDVEILKLLKPDVEEKFTLLPFEGKSKILSFTEIFERVVPELISRGFGVFGIVDKDKESIKPSEFCFVLPRACIENFLLDPEAIYEALKVIRGETELQREGIKIQNIEGLIEEIIKAPEFIEEEIREEIKTQLRFYIGGKWRNIDELERIAFETLKKKLDRIKEEHEKLRNEIEQIKDDKEKAVRELNGKLILGKIASRFNVERDVLARTIADKLKTLNKVPQDIRDLIEDIEEKASSQLCATL
ncbi:AAA family ATPase [Dehalococcoidales bacterium]|nr:AAA family ATPase [Dehalococcoidales bacterium]